MPKRQTPQGSPEPPSFASPPALLPMATLARAALIVGLVWFVYWPALSGGFILDDDRLLTNSKLIKAADGLYRFWFTTEPFDYWPVSNSTLWLEWRLWGMNPTGYHITNLLLHIGEVFLVWFILARLAIPGAYLAALLFAVHPVNVETVAWISQRKGLLAMLFLLLSILWYDKSDRRVPDDSSRPVDLWYGLSLIAFTLAMLSKVSAAVLPFLVLVLLWWRRPLTKRDLLRLAPFFVIFAVLLEVNIWFRGHGAPAPAPNATLIERFLGAGAVVWFYLYKAVLPTQLIFLYPEWHVDAQVWWWWLGLPAAAVTTGVLWWYRESWSRSALVAWAFFYVSLLPVLGFTDVGFMQHVVVADHYQHVALLAVVTLVAAGWATWQRRQTNAWLANALAVLAVGACTVLSWRQTPLYVNGETLYRATLERNPHAWMAHNNLGAVLTEAGRDKEAMKHYEEALRLFPDYPDAHNNLGAMLRDAGRRDEAVYHLTEAIRLEPNVADAYTNLGNIFLDEKRYPEAIELYQRALELNPLSGGTLNNLGTALRDSGRLSEGIEAYKQALQLTPAYAGAHHNLGVALTTSGQPQEALQHYEEAVRLQPGSANFYNSLGIGLSRLGRMQEAIDAYNTALRLSPAYAEAHFNLGLAHDNLQRFPEAIEEYKQAVALKPDHVAAYNNLGNVLAMTGNFAEAIPYFEEAVRLQPDYVDVRFNLAMALDKVGRSSEARLLIDEAIALKPDDPQVWANAVLAYTSIGESSKANEAAAKAKTLAQAKGQPLVAKRLEEWLAAQGGQAP